MATTSPTRATATDPVVLPFVNSVLASRQPFRRAVEDLRRRRAGSPRPWPVVWGRGKIGLPAFRETRRFASLPIRNQEIRKN